MPAGVLATAAPCSSSGLACAASQRHPACAAPRPAAAPSGSLSLDTPRSRRPALPPAYPAGHTPRVHAARRSARACAAAAASGASADLEVDVCVLGAGIIGLCTSLALLRADPGLRVALIDRQEPCAGATGAGQGYLWLAHRNVGSPLFRLAAQSRDMWRELLAPGVPQLTQGAVEWQEVGSMLLASTAEEGQGLQRRRELLAAEGLDAQLLTAAEIARLEPSLQLSPEASALLLPSDLQVNGRASAKALRAACEAHGARFAPLFGEGAVGLAAGAAGRVEAVHTEARRVHAARGVVVALGAWTGTFLAQQLSDVRWAAAFRPRRGLLLEMPRPESMPDVVHGLMEVGYTQHYSRPASPAGSTPTAGESAGASGAVARAAGGSGGVQQQHAAAAAMGHGSGADSDAQADEGVDITFTATTSASGTLLVGSSREFAGFDRGAPEGVVSAIMERAQQFLPGLAAVRRQDISVRSGPRPFSTAGAPMVAPVPGVEGLLVAAGHEGSGLTLAPATAALVCGYLLERPSRLDDGVVAALKCPFGMTI